MESVRNLIELLKSQLALYTEIKGLLTEEKQAIVEWKFGDTPGITKKKDALLHKERILEEARKTLAGRIAAEYGLENPTLHAIIEVCPEGDRREKLASLREKLIVVAADICNENTALKILYSTNIRLVNDLYAKMGYSPTNKSGMEKRSGGAIPSSISAIG